MKERLDVLLVKEGMAASREKAKTMILSGSVYVNGKQVAKPGTVLEQEESRLEVRGNILPYVSRGGLKLEKALKVFEIDLQDRVCMDIGASTGGFTDCMLQNGAKKVYAVDVGHDQLDEKLRNDKRVINMEKTNFRYLVPEDMSETADFASVDVSFISLSRILLPAKNLLKEESEMVCLIKPQFEAGRNRVGKKGVVKQPVIHKEVIQNVMEEASGLGFFCLHLDYSPVKGPEGNIEYLLHIGKSSKNAMESIGKDKIDEIVNKAHKGLNE